jgi:hypothetical protein
LLQKAPWHRRQHRGEEKGTAAAALTDGAEEEGARGCGEARPVGRGRAGRAAA